MKYKRFGDKIIARFDKGEEIMQTLTALAKKENIALASVNALGAVSKATISIINADEKKYYSKDFSGIYELSSLHGTVTTLNGEVYLHVHCTICDDQNAAHGGHLNSAVVSATCEMVIDVIDGSIGRAFSDEIGLHLMNF